MGQIVILDENTSNQIAAGEVVENPASFVKELIENSIDAGSSNITVEIQKGGITQIKVIDNGCGMEEDDVLL
jgi:DNA mismatch repair protein MutL